MQNKNIYLLNETAFKNKPDLNQLQLNGMYTVLFITMNGCHHCEAAKTKFQNLADENPNINFCLLDQSMLSQNQKSDIIGYPLFKEYACNSFSVDDSRYRLLTSSHTIF